MAQVQIGVIGGSGLYDLDGLKVTEEVFPDTPWGKPSDKIVVGEFAGKTVAFLPRHGRGHFYPPHQVPWRANLAALKMLGAEEIIAFSAVGSLREEIPPRDFILPSQIIDRTKSLRPSTYFEDGIVVHAMFGDPFSDYLADAVFAQKGVLDGGVTLHRDKTLVCMEGPAFSTRAESNMYRQLGGDIINMSVIPESKLARELEMSSSTFHSSFKAVTGTSPLQYIKNVRLQKARTLMLQDGLNALLAATEVGDESPSQFSREYKRLFGVTPAKDATGPAVVGA